MSRSRKKHPIAKDYSRGGTKEYKRLASKTVRRYRHKIADGNSYKKIYNSWLIHDYRYSSYWMDTDKEYWDKKLRRK